MKTPAYNTLHYIKPGIDMRNTFPPGLQNHRGFARTFQPGKLTLGLIAPFMGYADSPFPDMADFPALVKQADHSGLGALWVRDVPFYDPGFGDVCQIYDITATLGYLSAVTENITLGAAGYVSPLREPILTAKEAASIDQLSGGRFILGLAGGDRPGEYPAFGKSFDNRAERFRENWRTIRRLTEQSFPQFSTEHGGRFHGNIDLVPKPVQGRLPIMTVGRARQDLSWIANESDGWLWYSADLPHLKKIMAELDSLNQSDIWRPFATGNFVELLENAHAPLQVFNSIYLRSGNKALADFYSQQAEAGVAHIIANLKPTRRPPLETMQDFLENIVSQFQAG